MLQKTFRIEYFEPISNPNTHSMDNIFRKFWRAETSIIRTLVETETGCSADR